MFGKIPESSSDSSEQYRAKFEDIVKQYEKPIFNVALRMVSDYEEAMDITQCAFLKAYENLDNYDPSRKMFSWLYRIAINECINHLSKRKRTVRLEHDFVQSADTPELHFDKNDLSRSLESALVSLKFEYRVVVILRHFLDLSYRDIGEILEIPEKKVKSRLFTGRQLLRDILIEQGYVR